MLVKATSLPGVLEITPKRFSDDRGWFREVWNLRAVAEAGLPTDWVQDNESMSAAVDTIRGVHYQAEPMAQAKLVRTVRGRILDVAVDLRRNSPTFGQSVACELDAATGNQLLIPKGFGHGFRTLEPNCHIAYKVSAYYSAEHDRVIAWNDPTLGIDWGGDLGEIVLSAKDAAAPSFEEVYDDLFD